LEGDGAGVTHDPILISFSCRLVSDQSATYHQQVVVRTDLRTPELQRHPAVEIHPITLLGTCTPGRSIKPTLNRHQHHELYEEYYCQDNEIS